MFPPPRLLARPGAVPPVGEPIPVDPVLHTAMPSPADASADPSAAATALAVLDPSAPAFAALSVLHAHSLSDDALLDAVTASQKLLAAVAGKQQEFLAELSRRDPDGDEFLRDEVACVLQVPPATGRQLLDVAAQLAGRLSDTLELVTGGFLPYAHARVLATAVAHCPDQVAVKVQDRVLPRGCRQTLSEFRAAVRRAVARFDGKTDAQRHVEAFAGRKVVCYDDADYMAEVVLNLAADGAATVMTAINTWAVKTDRDDDRTLDQRRADAIVEIFPRRLRLHRRGCPHHAALDMPGLPRRHGMRPALSVTVAASTLAGQDDQPAELEGYGPIPAAMARRIAAMPGATRTEIAVDSQGRVVEPTDVADSYTPPVRIARTVIARDSQCVHPGCGRSAWYCELDHRTPWPNGPTSTDNLQALCTRHHKLKHHSKWRVEKLSDGSYEWTSPTRHTYRYRPPELPVPAEPSAPEQHDDDLPPF